MGVFCLINEMNRKKSFFSGLKEFILNINK